jgi:glycosyltransferase involved in cell wall biosynthesis
MRLLVLATDYPKKDESVALMYIHTRNKYYIKNGVNVTVLNFNALDNYVLDGVEVITFGEFKKKKNQYDILVSHAPNLRNHYKFLIKYGNDFSNTVFVFHGHEVLKISEIYPKPYYYMKTSSNLSIITHNVYDMFKLKMWKRYFTENLSKSHFVFVSQWMYDMFLKFVQVNPEQIYKRKHIIYNSIGEDFEKKYYDYRSKKEYDFITIRPYLDNSKYAIDIVTRIALMNPKYKFCVVGKGVFFKYNDMPDNLIWIDKNLSHKEIINFLNKSKCALLPTRTDSQGVMACEVATFGIPLITSNIDVCKEIFDGFYNVEYIDNDDKDMNIGYLFQKIVNMNNKEVRNTKYYAKNTIGKEIQLFNKILSKVATH